MAFPLGSLTVHYVARAFRKNYGDCAAVVVPIANLQ